MFMSGRFTVFLGESFIGDRKSYCGGGLGAYVSRLNPQAGGVYFVLKVREPTCECTFLPRYIWVPKKEAEKRSKFFSWRSKV